MRFGDISGRWGVGGEGEGGGGGGDMVVEACENVFCSILTDCFDAPSKRSTPFSPRSPIPAAYFSALLRSTEGTAR